MSPELLDPIQFGFGGGRPTKESDRYAMGMVIYEVLSGQVPLALHNRYIVSSKIIEGERPGRPAGTEGALFTDDLWRILEKCWSAQPQIRPTTELVLEYLERASRNWQPLPPGPVEDTVDDNESVSTVTYSCMFHYSAPSPMLTFNRWVKRSHTAVTDTQFHQEVCLLAQKMQLL